MLAWCRRTNTLVPGQWIHSKIPTFAINSDASQVLTFVQSYRKRHAYGTWVALSRPPWFTALATWQVGDAWGGRCGFLSDLTIYVEAGTRPLEFQGRLGRRMRWTSDRTQAPDSDATWSPAKEGGTYEIAKSSVPGLEAVRERSKSGAGSNWDVEIVLRDHKDRIRPLGRLENLYFSVFDPRGDFVFTRRDGTVWVANLVGDTVAVRQRFDLSEMAPEPIEAPPSATRW